MTSCERKGPSESSRKSSLEEFVILYYGKVLESSRDSKDATSCNLHGSVFDDYDHYNYERVNDDQVLHHQWYTCLCEGLYHNQ